MATTTLSIEEVEHNLERVGEASSGGPVFITRPGRSTLVVLDIDEYRKLNGTESAVAELPAYAGSGEIKFDRSRMTVEEYRKVTGHLPNLAELLAMPEGVGDFEFDPPRTVGLYNPNREVDLSD